MRKFPLYLYLNFLFCVSYCNPCRNVGSNFHVIKFASDEHTGQEAAEEYNSRKEGGSYHPCHPSIIFPWPKEQVICTKVPSLYTDYGVLWIAPVSPPISTDTSRRPSSGMSMHVVLAEVYHCYRRMFCLHFQC
jgi:hypothetical protein